MSSFSVRCIRRNFLIKSNITIVKRHIESYPAVHQKIAGRQRFYKHVDVKIVPDDKQNQNLYEVTLDGKTLKTPGRNQLLLPNYSIAAAIAAEWDSQSDRNKGIQPVSMPLMSIASTAIDQIQDNPSHARETCFKYLPTDTALYLTKEDDRLLLKKQRQHLQPIVKWLSKKLDIELKLKHDMYGRINHPEITKQKIINVIHQLDHFALTCLQGATMECKSVLLGIAYLFRHINLEQAKTASRLEEEFQVEIWGLVEGGHDMDRLNNTVGLSSVGFFMGLYWDDQALKNEIAKWDNYK